MQDDKNIINEKIMNCKHENVRYEQEYVNREDRFGYNYVTLRRVTTVCKDCGITLKIDTV